MTAGRLAWLVFWCGLGLRLGLAGLFQLSPDECNYWQWSRHLALGYHDHPPMVAWAMAASTALFGTSAWSVRLPTILAMAAGVAAMHLLCRRWHGDRAALNLELLVQGLLLFNGCALIATPDGWLVPAWAGACLFAARAMETNRWAHWLACGLCFGAGVLSKYTMFLFPPLLLLALLAAGEARLLASPRPWLGLALGLACFTPVLAWNAAHGWPTFRHVLYMGGADRKALFTLRYIGDFLGSQAALFSPVALWLLLAAWRQSLSWPRQPRDLLLTALSLPVLLLFLALSLHSRVYGNWTAPAYVGGAVLVAAHARPGRPWRACLCLAWLLCLPLLVHLVIPVLPVPARLDRTAKECRGWDQLAAAVQRARQDMPEDAFVFALRYQLASEMAFYLPGRPETVSLNRWTRPNVYDYWQDDQDFLGRDAIGITEHAEYRVLLEQAFGQVGEAEPVTVYRDSPWFGREPIRTFYIFRARNFRGGLRWQPRDPRDVRAGS